MSREISSGMWNESNFASTVSSMESDPSNLSNLASVTPSEEFCGQAIDDFHTFYLGLHVYFSLVVCTFGCIANMLNIAVLTRREMRSPTNAILTGLAISDLLVMIDYILYALYEANILAEGPDKFTITFATFVFWHAILTQMFHTISIFLTVILAIWRYIAISFPHRNRVWCKMNTTLKAIVLAYMLSPLISIPNYLSHAVIASDKYVFPNGTFMPRGVNVTSDIMEEHSLRKVNHYSVGASRFFSSRDVMLEVNLIVYSVIIKLIPCISLTFFSLRLIAALLEAKRRRNMLTGNNTISKVQESNGDSDDIKILNQKSRKFRTTDKERQTDRTTRMLLAILILFLVTEFPQGILGLLSLIHGRIFYENCYVKFGDFTDILALINSAINFILYCAMSRQFRKHFNIMFRPKFLPLPQLGDDVAYDRTEMSCRDNGTTTCATNFSQL